MSRKRKAPAVFPENAGKVTVWDADIDRDWHIWMRCSCCGEALGRVGRSWRDRSRLALVGRLTGAEVDGVWTEVLGVPEFPIRHVRQPPNLIGVVRGRRWSFHCCGTRRVVTAEAILAKDEQFRLHNKRQVIGVHPG